MIGQAQAGASGDAHEIRQQRLERLIEGFDTAMLVTTSLAGQLRARPMAIAGHAEGALLYFATRSDDEKMEEILHTPEVAVTMQAKDRFLSISGRARVETDVELARRLWTASMKIWFPEGEHDPRLTLLLVDPEYAEYWDRAGWRKLEFLWEAGKALARGEKADDDALSGHAKLKPE